MISYSHPVFSGDGQCKLVEFLNAALVPTEWYITSVEAVLPPYENHLCFLVHWEYKEEAAIPIGTCELVLWHTADGGWRCEQYDA